MSDLFVNHCWFSHEAVQFFAYNCFDTASYLRFTAVQVPELDMSHTNSNKHGTVCGEGYRVHLQIEIILCFNVLKNLNRQTDRQTYFFHGLDILSISICQLVLKKMCTKNWYSASGRLDQGLGSLTVQT